MFSARASTGPPLRSWSIIEKPPPVPMPGMAGGRNAKTCAAGIAANSRFSAARIALKSVSGVWRSCQGSRETKKNAL